MSIKMTKNRYIALAIVIALLVGSQFVLTGKAYEHCRLTQSPTACLEDQRLNTLKYLWSVVKS